jgi:hypothetical protein
VNEDIGLVTPLGYKQKIPTAEPVIFVLFKKKFSAGDTSLHYTVERKKLSRHGMQQLSMVL